MFDLVGPVPLVYSEGGPATMETRFRPEHRWCPGASSQLYLGHLEQLWQD